MWFPTLISTILMLALAYIVLGLIFTIALLIKGVEKVDPAAKGSGWGFKIIIIPGVVAFWPWLWKKWRGHP